MNTKIENPVQKHIGIAVDLGSTTIAVCCVDMVTKEEITTFSFSNPQYVLGADVITRIRHCVEDESMLCRMQSMVRESLGKHLWERLGESCFNISTVVYSGNTTMLHIVRGLSVQGLAAAPFAPVDLDYTIKEEPFFSVLSFDGCNEMRRNIIERLTAIYPPGFSAFVGADILTGAEYLNMGKHAAYDLLVDLGTNGEILLLNQNYGYAASTACGPVFDHAVAGAVYGSESIHAMANCIKRHLIDPAGKITDALFEKGIAIDKGFVIRQQNVRNFQLAKGAIYAGIQCLLDRAGISAAEVGNLYISGGLGFYMDIRDAFTVKMLPNDMRNNYKTVGNTSLEGAKRLLISGKDENILSEYEAIRQRTESVTLADLPQFQEIYMRSLDF